MKRISLQVTKEELRALIARELNAAYKYEYLPMLKETDVVDRWVIKAEQLTEKIIQKSGDKLIAGIRNGEDIAYVSDQVTYAGKIYLLTIIVGFNDKIGNTNFLVNIATRKGAGSWQDVIKIRTYDLKGNSLSNTETRWYCNIDYETWYDKDIK